MCCAEQALKIEITPSSSAHFLKKIGGQIKLALSKKVLMMNGITSTPEQHDKNGKIFKGWLLQFRLVGFRAGISHIWVRRNAVKHQGTM
nr:hypothetical protein CFP56_37001 [Quercus suber]